ncbi:MAG: cytochrome c3 family protein [Burkholderiaceae bacterium]|nr:cytochrome c3 family protein [Burkholderiaceae bacterium]
MKRKWFLLVLGLLGYTVSCFAATTVAPIHQAKGMQCEVCHTVMPKADYNKCLMCHGGKEKLAKSNSQHSILNSKESVPCSVCHKGHQR